MMLVLSMVRMLIIMVGVLIHALGPIINLKIMIMIILDHDCGGRVPHHGLPAHSFWGAC